MIRTCDGTDDLLQRLDGTPCACGLRFDDADRMVIYPHELISPPVFSRGNERIDRLAVRLDFEERLARLEELVGVRQSPLYDIGVSLLQRVDSLEDWRRDQS